MSTDHRVCIVGAGPVGLTLALALAREGLPVLVVERDRRPSTEWRAPTFHPPTLEMCEALGVVDDMVGRGLVAPKYQMRDWISGRVAEFDLGVLKDDTKYPFRLQLEQYKYAEILRDRLTALPDAELRYGISFAGVSDHPAGATVRLDGGSGPQETTSQWLVGADGASSTVRTFHGLDFPGMTYPKRMLIISLDAPILDWYPDLTYVNYISDAADHPGMLLKIPDAWRVSFELPDDVTDQQARSDEYVLARLRSVFPGRQPPPPLSTQIFRVHQRIAERFRVGRTLLVGDAAHLNNPSGGMGLNSGIHDAVDLARVLTDVLQGVAAEDALDEWAQRRRRAALEEVQRISHRRATEHATTDDEQLGDILGR